MACEISFGTTRFKPLPTTVNAISMATSNRYGLSRGRRLGAGGAFARVFATFLRMGSIRGAEYYPAPRAAALQIGQAFVGHWDWRLDEMRRVPGGGGVVC